eukprot:5498110-Prymnesium_polylepis.1
MCIRDSPYPVAGWAHPIRGPIRAGFAIEVQVNEESADEYQRYVGRLLLKPWERLESGASG